MFINEPDSPETGLTLQYKTIINWKAFVDDSMQQG